MARITGRNPYQGFLFVLALFPVLLCAPAAAQLFHPETAVLENGLRVVVVPNHRAPVVTHMLWVRAGAMDEPWGKSGIAHFLEHLMFKGTKRHPEGSYSRLVASYGGNENAFTSQDYTAYYVTVGKAFLPEIMALEADRFENLHITDEQVARERQVILKERQQVTENNPVAAFFEEVNATLYPNHPYQRPVIGWRNEIESLQRADAEAFLKRHYVASNAVLVLSGDITLDEAMPLVRRYYGGLPQRPVPQQQDDLQPALLHSKRTIEKASPLVRETVWSRHRLAPAARPENIAESDALLVLQRILGDSQTGRLYRRLVMEQKIATSASVSYSAVSRGPARLSLVVVPQPDVTAEKIAAQVDAEIAALLRDGVSDDEVAQATAALEIESVYARDSVAGPARIVGAALVSGLDIATLEAWKQRMRGVTRADVEKVARAMFATPDDWVTAILTPQADHDVAREIQE